NDAVLNGTNCRIEFYQGDPNAGGTLMRTIEKQYAYDGSANYNVCDDPEERNIRPSSEVTVYDDLATLPAAKQTAKDEMNNWDGRGHWREKKEYEFDADYDGTFNAPLYRTTITGYPDLDVSDPYAYLTNWILNTYDYVSVQDSQGVVRRYTSFAFDAYG